MQSDLDAKKAVVFALEDSMDQLDWAEDGFLQFHDWKIVALPRTILVNFLNEFSHPSISVPAHPSAVGTHSWNKRWTQSW